MTGQSLDQAPDKQPEKSRGYLLGAVDGATGTTGTLLDNVCWSSPGSEGPAATSAQHKGDASSGTRSVSDPGAASRESNVSRAGLDTQKQEEVGSAAPTVADNAKAALTAAQQRAIQTARAVQDTAQRTFDQSDDADCACADEHKGVLQGALDSMKGVAESVVDNVKWAVGVSERNVDDANQAVKTNLTSQEEDESVGGAFAGSSTHEHVSSKEDAEWIRRPQVSMYGDQIAADETRHAAPESYPQKQAPPGDRSAYGDKVLADGSRLAESDQRLEGVAQPSAECRAVEASTLPRVTGGTPGVQGALESVKVAAGTIVENVKWAVGAGGGHQPESEAPESAPAADATPEARHREFLLSDVPEHGFRPAQSGADDGKVVASSAIAASSPLGAVDARRLAAGALKHGVENRSTHGPVLELNKLSTPGAVHDKVVASSGDGTVAEKVTPVVAATEQEVQDAAAAAQQALASGQHEDGRDRHGVVQSAFDGVKEAATHVVDHLKWAVGTGGRQADPEAQPGQVSDLCRDPSEVAAHGDTAARSKGYVQGTVDQARAATLAVVETFKSAVGVEDKKNDDCVRLAELHEVFTTPRGTGDAAVTGDRSKGLVQGAVDSITDAASSVVETVKWAVGAADDLHAEDGAAAATVRVAARDVHNQRTLTARDKHQANYLETAKVKVEAVRKVVAEKATWAISQDNPLGKAVQSTADIARQAIITSAASAILGPPQDDSKQQPAVQNNQNSTVHTGEQKEEEQKKKGVLGKTADKFRGAGKGIVSVMRKAGLAAKKEKNHIVEAIDDAKHKGRNQG